jgi:autotransporter-associated beta strand protein
MGILINDASDLRIGGNGTIESNRIAGIGNVLKEGSGKLVFNQLNTYSGKTIIENGILKLGAPQTLFSHRCHHV